MTLKIGIADDSQSCPLPLSPSLSQRSRKWKCPGTTRSGLLIKNSRWRTVFCVAEDFFAGIFHDKKYEFYIFPKEKKKIPRFPYLTYLCTTELPAISFPRRRELPSRSLTPVHRRSDSWLGSEMHWPMTDQRADRIVIDPRARRRRRPFSPANSHVL